MLGGIGMLTSPRGLLLGWPGGVEAALQSVAATFYAWLVQLVNAIHAHLEFAALLGQRSDSECMCFDKHHFQLCSATV